VEKSASLEKSEEKSGGAAHFFYGGCWGGPRRTSFPREAESTSLTAREFLEKRGSQKVARLEGRVPPTLGKRRSHSKAVPRRRSAIRDIFEKGAWRQRVEEEVPFC